MTLLHIVFEMFFGLMLMMGIVLKIIEKLCPPFWIDTSALSNAVKLSNVKAK